MPGPFKSFRFSKIDMGDIPMRVGGIKVKNYKSIVTMQSWISEFLLLSLAVRILYYS